MKKLQTRSYQVRAAAHAMKTASCRLLIVAPGGAGKTAIITLITQAFVRKSKRVLIMSHRIEIIQQTLKMLKGRVRAGIIMGSNTEDPAAPVQVASVDTLRNRALPAADVLIIDEAHRAVSSTYQGLIATYVKRGAKLVGLTASPLRLDGVKMSTVFDEMYEAAKPSQLLGRYIMRPRVFSAKAEHLPNLSKIRNFGSEFVLGDMVREVNKRGLIGGVVDHAKKHLDGRTTVVFAASIEHSKRLAEALSEAGIPTLHVDGAMKETERAKILQRLEAGELQAVSCCMILSEGWDLPSCEAVILARPTRSLALFLQMCNRAVRMSARTPIILDHACNHVLHGYSFIDREWSLTGKDFTGGKEVIEKVLVCPVCYYINDCDEEECEECGAELASAARNHRILQERRDLELAEWNEKEMKRHQLRILSFAKRKGLSSEFAAKVLADLGAMSNAKQAH